MGGGRGGVNCFVRYQNPHSMPALLPCYRLNTDRCRTKASDHDMLDDAKVELFILHVLLN